MCISGTEPSSVILGQTKNFKKLKNDTPKVAKPAEAKRDGVINQQSYNFNEYFSFNTENFNRILIFSKRYESTEVYRRTWLLLGQRMVTTSNFIGKKLYYKCQTAPDWIKTWVFLFESFTK